MTLLQVWLSLSGTEQGLIIAIIVLLLGSIKIKPLELNLWGFIARKIGNALNHDLIVKVDEIETEFNKHVEHDKKKEALECRRCVLRFAREILMGQKHTREDFIEILDIIDNYNKYCKEHPDFPNSRAIFASKLILDNYQERLEKADFLAEEYRCQLVEHSEE